METGGSAGRGPRFHAVVLALLLFPLWPLLNFANHNREQLDADGFKIVALTFAAASTVAIAALGILDLVTRRRQRVGAGAATAMFVLLFFGYTEVHHGIVALFSSLGLARGENYVYLLVVVAVSVAAYRFIRSRSALALLLAFGVIANLLPALQLIGFALTSFTRGSAAPAVDQGLDDFDLVDRLNVYHIVLDGYARQDSLVRTVGYNNESFLEALEQRRFYVARNSYANYPTTFLSISSTVSMDYLATEKTPPFRERGRFYDAIQGNNPASHTLRKHGYRFVYLGSAWWDGSKCASDVDLCLSTSRAVRQALLSMTPLTRFVREAGRSVVADIGARLDEISGAQPVYLFAHTLMPHPPRTFTSNCEQISTLTTSGDDTATLTFWGDKNGYIRDLECTNNQVLALVDDILERDPSAVILVHGDHGTGFDVDWSLAIDAWPDRQIEERFAILMSIRLPEPCKSHLYPSLSPVNLYRVVFACLARVEPQLAPDILYVSPPERHPEYGMAHPYRRAVPDSRSGNEVSGSVVPTKLRSVP
jgi:hypothetical protein